MSDLHPLGSWLHVKQGLVVLSVVFHSFTQYLDYLQTK